MSDNKLSQIRQMVFSKGHLVSIHVGKWHMTAKLEEDDLQITNVPTIFQLGNKKLIKDEIKNKFTNIEGKARNLVKKHSFKFAFGQNLRFVSKQAWDLIRPQLDDFKKEYYTLVDDFLENYEKYKEEVLTDNPDYRDSLEPYYLPIVLVRKKFRFDYGFFELSFDNIKLEADYEEAKKKMYSFVEESVKGLRQDVIQTFEVLKNKLEGKKLITKTNIESVRELINTFETRNFFDDKKMQLEITKMKDLVKADIDYKNDEAANEELAKVVKEVLSVARNTQDVSEVTGEMYRTIEFD